MGKDRRYEIYRITLPDGRTYYGQHDRQAKSRGGLYRGVYMGSGKILTRYYKKYGYDGVRKDILYTVKTRKEADVLEKKVIKENRDLFNINIADGGEGVTTQYGKREHLEYKVTAGRLLFYRRRQLEKLLLSDDVLVIIVGDNKIRDQNFVRLCDDEHTPEAMSEIEKIAISFAKMAIIANKGKKKQYVIKGSKKVA